MLYRSSETIIDPYILVQSSPARVTIGNTTIARTQSTPRITAGQTTKVIVTCGQSNIGNFVGSGGDPVYTASNSNIDNFDISTGGTYVAHDYLLGNNGTVGSVGIRMADALRTAAWADRIILAPMAIGGTALVLWTPGFGFASDITVMFKRLASVGLTADLIIMAIGETDSAGGTTQASFESQGASCVALWRSAGFTTQPILWTLSTYNSGASNSTIRAAITAIANNNSNCVLGADTDTVTTRSDGTHYTTASALTAAGLHKDVIVAL